MCNGEGEYVCQDSQCRCQCAEEFPQCNCPITDIQIMEYTLANMAKSWAEAYKDLENSGREPHGTTACMASCQVYRRKQTGVRMAGGIFSDTSRAPGLSHFGGVQPF